MAKSGLQNPDLLFKIAQSGSLAVKPKNGAGVSFFLDTEYEDGVVYGKLTKPKYDLLEVSKSLDLEIDELIPIEKPQGPAMVLKSIYDEALATIDSLNFDISQLQVTQSQLNNKINELHQTTQSLKIENDNQKLLASVAQNQSEQTNLKLQENVVDLQNAIQKSISEAIARVSLKARVESLQQENSTLKDQLFGKQAAVQEGSLAGEDFAIKVLAIAETAVPGLLFVAKAKTDTSEDTWINGPRVQIDNFTSDPVTLSFEATKVEDHQGVKRSVIQQIRDDSSNTYSVQSGNTDSITIAPESKKEIIVEIDSTSIKDNLKPRNGSGYDRKYVLNLLVKSNKSTLNIPMTLRKQFGRKFSG